MAEANRVVLDDFSDGGAKWAYAGWADGSTHSIAASATNAGTALGNLAATKTLAYTFATPADTQAYHDVSILCTLPAAVDVSALSFLCTDLWFDAAFLGRLYRQPRLIWTTDKGSWAFYVSGFGNSWAIGRQTVANLIANALDARVSSLKLDLLALPGQAATVYVDTLRACTYQYSADDMRLYGRRPGLATNAQVDSFFSSVLTYLFGSPTAVVPGAAGLQTTPGAANYGAFRNWNPFTLAEVDAGLAGGEADMDAVGGALVQGLVTMYRMTGQQAYLTLVQWFIRNFWEAWTDLRPGSASYGFMPQCVSQNGTRYTSQSTDNSQLALLGLLDYWIAGGRNDQGIATLIEAWVTWWQSANHVNYDGSANSNAGGISGVHFAAKNFVTSGDAGGVLDPNGNPVSASTWQGYFDPAQFAASYRKDYLAAGPDTQNVGLGYSALTLREPLVMNRLSRTKQTIPTANLTTLVQENWLFARAIGNPYYETDLPGDFDKRSLMAFTPTEAAAPWNSTQKKYLPSTTGPADAADSLGALEDAQYVLDAARDLPGWDVPGLIAVGGATSESLMATVDALVRETAQKGLIAPGTAWDGLPVRAMRGLYAWYSNNQGSVRNAWDQTVDFHVWGHFIAVYAFWYQFSRYTGLWPELAGRVLDWAYNPSTLTLRLVANGQPGDAVSLPIHGLQSGHRYACVNETTGARQGPVAGGSTFTLAWTLAQHEESWLVYDVAQPPAKTFASPAGLAPAFASPAGAPARAFAS